MEIIIAACAVLIFIFSFIKTPLRPFSIVAAGLFLGIFFIADSLKIRHTSVGMGGVGDGIAEAIIFLGILISYTIYLLILLIMWWRQRKRTNIIAALQIKRGMAWSLIIVISASLASFLRIPVNIRSAVEKRKAAAAFKYEYELISDSIKNDSTNYYLYVKRARLGEPFFYGSTEYFFGDYPTKERDVKKAYSLNPNDYKFVISLAYIFTYIDDQNTMAGSGDANEHAQKPAVVKTGADSLASMHINAMDKFFLYHAHMLLQDSLHKQILHQPSNGKWYYQLGMLHEEMGDTTTAVADFEKLNTVQPGHEYNIYNDMAAYYLKKGDIEKSDACYRKLIGDYTFNEGPFEYFSERGRWKESVNVQAAISDYKEALKNKPTDYTLRDKLKSLYLSVGDSINARKYNFVPDTANLSR